jgi:microcystin-dependent protein
MSESFLGELKIVSFNFAPKGWAQCNGQTLPINQNQALFSLLGTMYGGDGRSTFALPDLRSRTPLHVGSGLTQGDRFGTENHTLVVTELPAHSHGILASNTTATLETPVNAPNGNALAKPTSNLYGAPTNLVSTAQVLSNVGGSQPHSNQQPYLGLNICIALQGIYPSQN